MINLGWSDLVLYVFGLTLFTNLPNLSQKYNLSKNSTVIFLLVTYFFAGCSSSNSFIVFKSVMILVSSNTGLKSNEGFGVAGAPFLYLSKRYSEYIFGSIDFMKFAKF